MYVTQHYRAKEKPHDPLHQAEVIWTLCGLTYDVYNTRNSSGESAHWTPVPPIDINCDACIFISMKERKC